MTAGLGRLWVKRPLFILAAGLVIVAAVESRWPGFSWIAGLALAVLAGVSGGRNAAFSASVLALLLVAGTRWHDGRQARDEERFSSLGIRKVEARLTEDAEGGEGVWPQSRSSTAGKRMAGR